MGPFLTVVLGYVPGLLPGGLVNTAAFSSATGDVLSPGTTANSASPAAPAEGISRVVFKEKRVWDFLPPLPPKNWRFFAFILLWWDTFEMCVLSVCTCIIVSHDHHPILFFVFCGFFETLTYLVCACRKLLSAMDQRWMGAWHGVCFPPQKPTWKTIPRTNETTF